MRISLLAAPVAALGLTAALASSASAVIVYNFTGDGVTGGFTTTSLPTLVGDTGTLELLLGPNQAYSVT